MMTDSIKYNNQPKRLLRLKGVLTKIPVSRTTFYSGIKTGQYPAPIKLGSSSMWLESDIDSVIDNAYEELGGKDGR